MPFPIKNLPKHILDKLDALEGIRARKLENGNYEIYEEVTGKVIHTVTKKQLDEAAERLDLPPEAKKRTLW